MNDNDKTAMRREAARIMAEMSKTHGMSDAPKTSAKKRPSTAKKASQAQPKDKDEKSPWIPPMMSTAKKDLSVSEVQKPAVPATDL